MSRNVITGENWNAFQVSFHSLNILLSTNLTGKNFDDFKGHFTALTDLPKKELTSVWEIMHRTNNTNLKPVWICKIIWQSNGHEVHVGHLNIITVNNYQYVPKAYIFQVSWFTSDNNETDFITVTQHTLNYQIIIILINCTFLYS